MHKNYDITMMIYCIIFACNLLSPNTSKWVTTHLGNGSHNFDAPPPPLSSRGLCIYDKLNDPILSHWGPALRLEHSFTGSCNVDLRLDRQSLPETTPHSALLWNPSFLPPHPALLWSPSFLSPDPSLYPSRSSLRSLSTSPIDFF